MPLLLPLAVTAEVRTNRVRLLSKPPKKGLDFIWRDASFVFRGETPTGVGDQDPRLQRKPPFRHGRHPLELARNLLGLVRLHVDEVDAREPCSNVLDDRGLRAADLRGAELRCGKDDHRRISTFECLRDGQLVELRVGIGIGGYLSQVGWSRAGVDRTRGRSSG